MRESKQYTLHVISTFYLRFSAKISERDNNVLLKDDFR